MKSSHIFKLETRDLDSIIPYWRNPRKISDEAVNAVAESISRYGYRQPIVVDKDGVIIVGHTRYAALRRLGYTEAEVGVAGELTAMEVRQLRAIDNKTAEYSTWDFDKLVNELEHIDSTSMAGYFPELLKAEDDSDQRAEKATEAEAEANFTNEFICPSCFHMWNKEVTSEDIRKGLISGE